ncbi:MAG: hypothetical protein R3B46_02805 [Phycisphaerales bacterium]
MRVVRVGVPALLLAAVGTAQAGVVNIGGGWQASWDSSLDGLVQIVSDGVAGDAVFIEKSIEFTGGFNAVPIVFTQIDPNAVSNIVINDEIISNNSGVDWSAFRMQLIDGGDVAFDQASTASSGGSGPIGFSISPFTTASFTPDSMQLNIGGGTVPNGTQWFPGAGVSDGQLWMHVNLTPGQNKVFTLKESYIPTPGAVALFGVAGLAAKRRRR